MSTKAKLLSIAALATASLSLYAADHSKTSYGFGSTPSAAELAQFTSPLPDGRGLPPGKGTVSAGKTLYENQCLACHGQKLEGGMGDKLIGGRGSLVNNDPTKKPVKTVESYWPYATTLFDYIKRAMPLLQPGSLSNDEVYALSAYILAEGKIIPQDATLDAASLAKIKMPNRDGFIPDQRPDKFRATK
jgi:cytochrome c